MNMRFVRGRRERMVSVGWESNILVVTVDEYEQAYEERQAAQ